MMDFAKMNAEAAQILAQQLVEAKAEADGLSRSLNAAVAELDEIRNATIEECAKAVESHRGFGITVQGVAAAIRALKSND